MNPPIGAQASANTLGGGRPVALMAENRSTGTIASRSLSIKRASRWSKSWWQLRLRC